MKKTVLLITGVFFLIMGGLFCGIYKIVVNNYENFKIDAEETIATIVEVDHEKDEAIIIYNDNSGNEHRVHSDYYSFDMEVGDELKVYYKKTNPSKFQADVSPLLTVFNYVFYGVGGLLILIGTIMIVISIRNSIRSKKLLSEGFRINATIKDVMCNTMINVNGKHPYIIKATFEYNGVTYDAKSKNLWFDASDVINTYGIKEVPVCININNPKEYVMDLSELEQRSNN